jgi:hypothetical protein
MTLRSRLIVDRQVRVIYRNPPATSSALNTDQQLGDEPSIDNARQEELGLNKAS